MKHIGQTSSLSKGKKKKNKRRKMIFRMHGYIRWIGIQ